MVVDLPPRDRGKDESKLDEQDFAWWTKQLGREPTRPGSEAATPSPAPTADDTDLLDALWEADQARRAEERERAATARESPRRPEIRPTARPPSPAVTEARSEPLSPQWHDPIAEATRTRIAARLVHGLHAVLYSSHHPYPAVRRAAGYTLIFVGAALIAWLLASLQ
jgi:hypothetical protein